MKSINYKNYFNYLLVFIFFFIFYFSVANYIGLNRHWSSVYDQEFTLTYNALLFNSGLLQEYVDHSAYFTILFLSIFLKICNIIGLLKIYKFNLLDLNNLNESLQSVIFFTRIYSVICVTIFSLTTNIIFNKISGEKKFSFFLTLSLGLFSGTIFHTTQLRSDLIAEIFFLLGFLNLKLFFDNKDYKIINLILFYLFIYCSILNKSQTFFYLPGILLLIYFISSKVTNFSIVNFLFLKKKETKYILIFFVISYLFIKYLSEYQRSILSIIFLIFNIFLINYFFYLIFKKNKNEIKNNLIVINFTLIIVFIFFKNFLFIHPSTNEFSFFNTFTGILLSKKYIDLAEVNNVIFFYSLITKYLISLYLTIKIIFFPINTYSILIILNILLLYIYKKDLKKNIQYFNIACILFFIYIFSLNNLRGQFSYRIFSDFFLILPLCNFYKLFKFKNLFSILIFLSIFFFEFQKNNQLLEDSKKNINNLKTLCNPNEGYFYDWHKKIPKDSFSNICKYNKY
jgi:hypothetical protein